MRNDAIITPFRVSIRQMILADYFRRYFLERRLSFFRLHYAFIMLTHMPPSFLAADDIFAADFAMMPMSRMPPEICYYGRLLMS